MKHVVRRVKFRGKSSGVLTAPELTFLFRSGMSVFGTRKMTVSKCPYPEQTWRFQLIRQWAYATEIN
jgi:hypothetical protein